MKVEIKIDGQCEETTVIVIARELSDEVNELAQMLSNSRLQLIVGFKDNNAVVVETRKIVRIYTANQKVYIVADDGEYVSRLRLYEFEERLPNNTFVRVSNSEIINLQKVKDFDLSFSGSICVRFINGKTTYVSRRYVAKIKTMLGM
ncbi:transcriptional regulator [Bacteroidia bacterium]|nr:transcriptional regulator [Bacteroidia bacterium]